MKKKMILINEDDLSNIVSEAVKNAVTNALDAVTKKISAKCATLSYNNEMFKETTSKRKSMSNCGLDDNDEDYDDYDNDRGYGCGNAGYSSGCGSSSSRSSGGGCGGGYSSGGC